ncbi:MAG: SDR family NAD(P)-dependent oxidoreductase, partial [Opitutales bacterium]|nr:SDR family NAD(P)-dependent oxidoreductase [Opitutales bacterium]
MVEKIALVTGAASGIGRGIAEKFLREGARVLMLDINAKALELSASKFKQDGLENFILRQFDVSKQEDWALLADFLQSEFGALHALINNA